jgi:hypothetical protein
MSGKEEESKITDNNVLKSEILDKKNKPLYKKYKKDLDLSEFIMKKAINNVDNWVIGVENQRNYKMKQDFDKEKEFKLAEQNEIKNQIEELSNDNANEQLIQYFNEKISEQKQLYNDYNQMNENIISKIKMLKETIPSLEQKVKKQNEDLKLLNKENLKLMDQISKMESEINYQNSIIENNNNMFNYNPDINNNNNYNLDSARNINNYSSNSENSSNILSSNNRSKGESVNLNEIIEENESIRNQYNQIMQLKKIFKKKKKENLNLLKNISEMNTECFSYKKMFNEGMHEIAKELLKLHEMQLDKVINNNGENNANSNSIYFEMVKRSGNGNDTKNDTLLKLPIINSNIVKKYNFPVTEKRTPETLIFNAIKKMVDESHNLNKVINLKKNKFTWEEFRHFSAYQIYTILNLNKNVIKKLENYIFPNKVVFPTDFDY